MSDNVETKDYPMTDASAAEEKPKKKKSLPPPRFEIKKWNAVAMWSWDICADTVSYINFLLPLYSYAVYVAK
jgi:hypothetical protein